MFILSQFEQLSIFLLSKLSVCGYNNNTGGKYGRNSEQLRKANCRQITIYP